MKGLVCIFLAVLVGCGGTSAAVQFEGIPKSRWVETKDLPTDADLAKVPDADNWSIPLLTGDKATADGIFMSYPLAYRYGQVRISYRELMSLYQADRAAWQEQRNYYEEVIYHANDEIVRETPTYFDSNKGTLGLIGGFLLGAAVTVGIVYSLGGAN